MDGGGGGVGREQVAIYYTDPTLTKGLWACRVSFYIISSLSMLFKIGIIFFLLQFWETRSRGFSFTLFWNVNRNPTENYIYWQKLVFCKKRKNAMFLMHLHLNFLKKVLQYSSMTKKNFSWLQIRRYGLKKGSEKSCRQKNLEEMLKQKSHQNLYSFLNLTF